MFLEKAREERVGDVIEDHEPRVHRHLTARLIDRDSVRVAADVIVLFEYREIEAFMQKMSAAEPGNSSANDRPVGDAS